MSSFLIDILISFIKGVIKVYDPPKLASDVLHKYFRHSKYSSFQRQLNYFGFRKISGKGKLAPCSYINDHVTSDLLSLLSLKVCLVLYVTIVVVFVTAVHRGYSTITNSSWTFFKCIFITHSEFNDRVKRKQLLLVPKIIQSISIMRWIRVRNLRR